MSHSALIDNLRTRGEEQIAALRRQAREEIDTLQAEAARQLAEAENSCFLTAAQSRETVRRKLAVAAQRQAATIATRGEQELNRRLYALAGSLLSGLQGEGRAGFFAGLAAELPDHDWQTVTVHPEDKSAARHLFPRAETVADDGITGGLVASSGDGAITVINTLEKRLERLWPWLAPEILREVVANEPAD